ncbi:helix-turn-helix transcriptional regulator [Myroides sp. LJL116]
MSINKIKQKLVQNSIKDSKWLEKAKWRKENEHWLDISFNIAVKIGSILSANKKTNTYPKTQVELAELMDCSPQYVNKLLKGEENLQIDTICKISKILATKLIEVPEVELRQTISYDVISSFITVENTISSPVILSSPVAYSHNLYANLEIKTGVGNNYASAA